MKKPDKRLNASETLELLNNPWLTAKDIMKLMCLGEARAYTVVNEIKERVKQKGYKLPKGYIPVEEVINYYNININLLKKLSK